MLNELTVLNINKNLTLSDSYRLNNSEINKLELIYDGDYLECETYKITQIVLTARSVYDTSQNDCLRKLVKIASTNNCNIELEKEIVPSVNIPIFCLSV